MIQQLRYKFLDFKAWNSSSWVTVNYRETLKLTQSSFQIQDFYKPVIWWFRSMHSKKDFIIFHSLSIMCVISRFLRMKTKWAICHELFSSLQINVSHITVHVHRKLRLYSLWNYSVKCACNIKRDQSIINELRYKLLILRNKY